MTQTIEVDTKQVVDNPEIPVLEISAIDTSKELAKFDPLKLRLARLQEKVATTVYDITTGAGMKTACELRRECVSTRTAANKTYETLNAPLLAAQRGMRDLVKEIGAVIAQLEDRLDAEIKAQEAIKEAERQRKVAAEEARIKALREKIAVISGLPAKAVLRDADGISALDRALSELVIDESSFAELADEAQTLKTFVRSQLSELFVAALAREAAAEQVRLESIRLEEERAARAREAEIRGRIANIQGYPLRGIGQDAAAIRMLIEHAGSPQAEDFYGLLPEAELAYDQALTQLGAMLDARLLADEVAATAARREQEAADQRQRDADAAVERQRLADEQHDARSKELKRQQDAFEAERLEAKVQQDARDEASRAERQAIEDQLAALQPKPETKPEPAEAPAPETPVEPQAAAAHAHAKSAPCDIEVLAKPIHKHESADAARPTDGQIAILVRDHYQVHLADAIGWLANFDASEAWTTANYEEIPS